MPVIRSAGGCGSAIGGSFASGSLARALGFPLREPLVASLLPDGCLQRPLTVAIQGNAQLLTYSERSE